MLYHIVQLYYNFYKGFEIKVGALYQSIIMIMGFRLQLKHCTDSSTKGFKIAFEALHTAQCQ